MINITTIVTLTIKTPIETSTMLTAIATMIAQAVAIMTSRIVDIVDATTIKIPIATLDQTLLLKKSLMPCMLMLAAKQAVLTCKALPHLPSTQGAPPPLHPTTAARPGLVKTTTSPTKDATALCHHARELTLL